MANKNDEERVVPTGSQVQDNSGTSGNTNKDAEQETSDAQKSQSSQDQDASSQSKGSEQTEGGEQKSGTDQQPQDTQGQRSTEELLQTLQQSQQEINQKLDGMQKPSDDGKSQEPDYDSQLNELDRMLQEGELNLSDYQTRQRSIMEQKAKTEASSVVDQKLQEKEMEQASDQYLQQNPDFQQYYNSQSMQQTMKQNPLLDEVGAYEHLKRVEAESKVGELQQQLEQLQKEREQAVKNGAQVTDTVGKDSGSALQHGEVENNKNLTPQDGMMAALQRARQTAE